MHEQREQMLLKWQSSRARVWTFSIALAGLLCDIGAAKCTDDNPPMHFDIPTQPLSAAISQYGDATGSEALYDASLASGRYSGSVQGMMTAPEGLRRLLVGTGLAARFISREKFVVTRLPSAPGPQQDVARPSAHLRYYGVVQHALLDTLCRLDGARPGQYRIIVALRIASNGAAEHALRIGSAGIAETDRQIDAALRTIRFSEPPPADFEQPVRILLAPEWPGGTPACAAMDARLRAAGDIR